MTDPVNFGAAVLTVVQIALDARARIRDARALSREQRLVLEIIDEALVASIREAALDPGVRTEIYEKLKELIESGNLEWLASVEPSQVPDLGELTTLGHAGPRVAQLLVRFREIFVRRVVDVAAGPNSLLFNQFTVNALVTLQSRLDDVYTRLSTEPPAERTEASSLDVAQVFPPMVAARVGQLQREAPVLADRLLEWLLLSEGDRRAALPRLLHAPPIWLETAPEGCWVAIAELAQAHDLNEVASAAFRKAAEAENSQEPARWLARAGLLKEDGSDAQRELLDSAREAGRDEIERFLDIHDAIAEKNFELVRDLGNEGLSAGVPESTMVTGWVAQALDQLGQTDPAVDALESLLATSPTSAGILILLAQIRLGAANESTGARAVAYAEKALADALRARDLRRLWNLDSVTPARLAASAAAVLERWNDVIEIGSVGPDGATVTEAADDEIAELVTMARFVRGEQDIAEPVSDFHRHWSAGLSASRDPERRDEALESFRLATLAALTPVQLDRAQRGLALLGATDIPRLEETQARDPERADILSALSMSRRGQGDAAERILRPLAPTNAFAAFTLGGIVSNAGDHAGAGEVLRSAAERLGDPNLYAMAAEEFLLAEEIDRAEATARSGLAVAPSSTDARQELFRALISAGRSRADPEKLIAVATEAIRDGFDEPSVRWTLVEGLAAGRRWRDALHELDKDPALEPSNDRMATLRLHVLARAAPARMDEAVELMDAFATSHEVVATGISLFLGLDSGIEYPEDVRHRFWAHVERYQETFPEGTAIRPVDVSVDDPELMLRQIDEALPDEPEHEARVIPLVEAATEGQLPIAIATLAANRPYVATILTGDLLPFISTPADPELLRMEVQDATRALDQTTVVDVTSLVVHSSHEDSWTHVTQAFRTMQLAERQFVEIDDLMFNPPPVGFFIRDRQTRRVRMVDHDDSYADEYRTRRARVRDRANGLVRVRDDNDLESLQEIGRRGAWSSGLAVAANRRHPLLVDDVALASLARSMGIRSFSTFSLLLALHATGRLDDARLNEFTTAMFAAGNRDLPLSVAGVDQLSADLGDPVGPVCAAMARASYWRFGRDSLVNFLQTARRVLINSPDDCPPILAAGTRGLLRRSSAAERRNGSAALFVGLVMTPGIPGEVIPNLLAASRAACAETETEDPLPMAVDMALKAMIGPLDASEAARQTAKLFSSLDSGDVRLVTERILKTDGI